MRKILLLPLIFLLLFSCKKEDKFTPEVAPPEPIIVIKDTIAPQVNIVTFQPSDTIVSMYGNITVFAKATDNKKVQNVKFYLDGIKLNEDTSYPYTILLPRPLAESKHILKAIAQDEAGNIDSTADITFRAVSGFPNQTFIMWQNQTSIIGGFTNIYRNGILFVTSVNTGLTIINSFLANQNDIINTLVFTSPGEITPFGVRQSPGTSSTIPGSYTEIPGNTAFQYAFTVDTTYDYTITWAHCVQCIP